MSAAGEHAQFEQLLQQAVEENEILRDRVTELEALLVAAEDEIEKRDLAIQELVTMVGQQNTKEQEKQVACFNHKEEDDKDDDDNQNNNKFIDALTFQKHNGNSLQNNHKINQKTTKTNTTYNNTQSNNSMSQNNQNTYNNSKEESSQLSQATEGAHSNSIQLDVECSLSQGHSQNISQKYQKQEVIRNQQNYSNGNDRSNNNNKLDEYKEEDDDDDGKVHEKLQKKNGQGHFHHLQYSDDEEEADEEEDYKQLNFTNIKKRIHKCKK